MVVVVVLLVAGVLSLPSGPVGSSPTFDAAQGPANSAAHGVSGGPWHAVIALGLATTMGVSVPVGDLGGEYAALGCNVSYPSGSLSSIFVPPTGANATVGGAAAWIFDYANASGFLFVAVLNGRATPLFSAYGGQCSFLTLARPLSDYSPLVDSSVAVSAANAAGGTQFLHNYSGVDRIWILSGDPLTDQATWGVTYTTCSPSLSTGSTTGYFFNATVNAATGHVNAHSVATESCSSIGMNTLRPSSTGFASPTLPRD